MWHGLNKTKIWDYFSWDKCNSSLSSFECITVFSYNKCRIAKSSCASKEQYYPHINSYRIAVHAILSKLEVGKLKDAYKHICANLTIRQVLKQKIYMCAHEKIHKHIAYHFVQLFICNLSI